MSNNQNSFAASVKEEMLAVKQKKGKEKIGPRHCNIAEIATFIACNGNVGRDSLTVRVENERIGQKYFTLLEKTFNINADALENKGFFEVTVSEYGDAITVLQAIKLFDQRLVPQRIDGLISTLLIKNTCCKQAFIKTAFLLIGSMSDPRKSSHVEFVCNDDSQAGQIVSVLKSLEITARTTIRKNRHVVYIKDSDNVGDFIRLMEAPKSIMEYENIMILRETANKINRVNNCDLGNIRKRVNAANRQIDDINYLSEHLGFENLPESLRQIAILRVENPEEGLKELGELMKPPLGKSGVNHRLRKLCEMANEMREKQE